jgi:erythromycin esterase
MKQWLKANAPDGDNALRSRLMTDNVIEMANRLPTTKFMVWAHNSHIIGRMRLDPADADVTNRSLGEHLRTRFGVAYYAIGFEFNEGQYLTRVLEDGKRHGELKVASAPAAPDHSLASVLSHLGRGNVIVDLRDPAPGQDVEAWLASPHVVHDGWWGYLDPAQSHVAVPLRPYFDAVVFVNQTSPTRPTPNGATAGHTGARF